jgi:hypothetical protein
MFEFIKSLFKRKSATNEEASTCPFLVHADINESIVINEVELVNVKPKKIKPKVTKLTEVKPVKTVTPVVAKGVKPAKPKTSKAKPVKVEPAKIVQLVQPTPVKKKGRPKKDTTV